MITVVTGEEDMKTIEWKPGPLGFLGFVGSGFTASNINPINFRCISAPGELTRNPTNCDAAAKIPQELRLSSRGW